MTRVAYQLTEDAVRRTAGVVREFAGRTLSPSGAVPETHQVYTGGPRWATVDDNAAMAGEANRWDYTLTFIDDAEEVTDAVNRMEDGNDANVAGPGVKVADLPTGFKVCPIGEAHDGTAVACVVPCWFDPDLGSDGKWCFCVANSIDGECPE